MDLALIAANSRRAGAGGDTRAPIGRVLVSARMLLPLALAQGAAAESELARDLRGRAATDASVALLLPAGRASDSSRLDTGVRQYRLSPALRDAIVAALAGRADTEEAAPLAASPTPSRAWPPSAESSEPVARAQGVGDAAAVRAWAVGAQATAARGGLLAEVSASEALLSAGETAARALARSAGTDVNGSLDAVGGGRAVNFAQALLDGDAQSPAALRQIAERLQQTVERSGLFYESHVAQWAHGQRTTDTLRQELLALGAAAGQNTRSAAADRVPAQLELLQRQTLVLQGPAWAGQSSWLEFGVATHEPSDTTDERSHGSTEAPAGAHAVVSARLRLNMPILGPIEVRLRLAGESIAMVVAGATGTAVPAALAELRERFEARGLKPVSLVAVAAVLAPESER